MRFRVQKAGYERGGVVMYKVRDGRNGPTIGPPNGKGPRTWSKAEAEAIAAAANRVSNKPAERALSGLTLAQAAKRFIERCQAGGSHKMEHYRLPWFERHAIGRTQLRNLTTPQCRRWADWLLREGVSDETLRKLLSLASAVVKDAIERGFGPRANPFRDVSRPKRVQRPAPRVMPREHEPKLEHMAPRSRCIVLVFLWTGLRRGELSALEMSDILTTEPGTWLEVTKGAVGSATTKTQCARRVRIWGRGLEALLEWMREHRPKTKRARNSSRVFPVCLGRYIAAPVWEAAGLPHYTPNELRHTHSTGLVAGRWGYRWPNQMAAERCGHSVKIQQEHYINVTGGPAEETAELAARAWAKLESPLERERAGSAPESRVKVAQGDSSITALTVENPWLNAGRARRDSNARLLASEAINQTSQAVNISDFDGSELVNGTAHGTMSELAALVIAADAIGDIAKAARLGMRLASVVLDSLRGLRTA